MDNSLNGANSLSFENINNTTLNEQNIGGPPIPMYEGCTTSSMITNTNDQLTNEQKHMAYLNYVNNNGYVPFDYTQLTNSNANTNTNMVNNTAFFLFFAMFILFLILILVLMAYGHLDVIIGLHLIILFTLIIYVMSILYRNATLTNINTSQTGLNSAIAQDRVKFENSIIQLPNNIMNVANTLNSTTSTAPTTQPIVMTQLDPCHICHSGESLSESEESEESGWEYSEYSESECSSSLDTNEIYLSDSMY